MSSPDSCILNSGFRYLAACRGVVHIGRTEIISGSDGILPDSEESGDRIIEKALKEIRKVKGEQEFMDEVYQEIKLTLCGPCRLIFRDGILDMIKY